MKRLNKSRFSYGNRKLINKCTFNKFVVVIFTCTGSNFDFSFIFEFTLNTTGVSPLKKLRLSNDIDRLNKIK